MQDLFPILILDLECPHHLALPYTGKRGSFHAVVVHKAHGLGIRAYVRWSCPQA
jgi:hypothetical protein